MKKKLLATILSASMVVGIAACGSQTAPASTGEEAAPAEEKTETATEAAPAETTETADTAAAAGIDGWEPFAETVSIKIPVYDRGDNGNGCSDVENNYWTKWVQENFGDKYNVNISYVGITRSANLKLIQYKLYQLVASAAEAQTASLADTGGATQSTPEVLQAASIMFVTIPILVIYPFLQKYFVQGTMIGAVKG